MSFYLVPIVGSGTKIDPRRPKYVPALGVPWQMVDFGDSAIVWANASPPQDSTIGANADATVIPALDNTVAVTATKNALEALNMPGQWVTAGMTYRSVLRVAIGMAQLFQCVWGILGAQVSIAGHLDDTIGSFPLSVRNAIAQACDTLNIDRTNIISGTLLREALRDFGQQFVTRGVSLGDL